MAIEQKSPASDDLLVTLIEGIGRAPNVSAALAQTVELICARTEWVYGEAWRPAADGSVLEMSPAHYAHPALAKELERFRAASRRITFAPAEGLPGRVWASRRPEWVRDVSRLSPAEYTRVDHAAPAGLKAALAVPILSDDTLLAVLVFYMSKAHAKNERLVQVVSAAAAHLGLMLGNIRVKQTLRQRTQALNDRVKELNLLYTVSNVLNQKGLTEGETAQIIVNSIPPAWQTPANTCARLRLGGHDFVTDGFRETPWRQHRDLTVGGERIGSLDVYYLEERAPSDHPPFGQEEAALLDFVTRQLQVALERQQMEQALRENEKRFHALVQNGKDLISILDRNGKIRLQSPTAVRALGYEPETMVGRSLFDFVHPSDLMALKTAFREIVATSEKTRAVEFRMQHKNGSWHPLETTVTNLLDNPAVGGIVANAKDVTARHQAEKALQQYAADLAHSNEELQQFAYIASHDLQEPLRMITSYLQLLQRRYSGRLDDDADEFIDYAVDGATRMKQLINDLLGLSRIGTRGQPFAPTDMEAVLHRVLSDLKFTIEDNDAIVTHDPLPTVMADDKQMAQLLQNLVENAIKFRGEETPTVHVGTGRQEDAWTFTVRDNGIGVDPQYYERIFITFQRLHNSAEYEGTGIGLAMCKKIVERHGGQIWVESDDEGSTFTFTLPTPSEGITIS